MRIHEVPVCFRPWAPIPSIISLHIDTDLSHRIHMPLTQMAILKAAVTKNRLSSPMAAGLHLLVQPNGSKLRRFRYRFAGGENVLTLGVFPTITLASARQKREEARRLWPMARTPALSGSWTRSMRPRTTGYFIIKQIQKSLLSRS